MSDQQHPSTIFTDPHHTRADLQMLERAVKNGWIKGTRWPTDATHEDFVETLKTRPLTVKERATLAVLKGLSSGEARIEQAAVKNVVSMEAQNQADELKTSVRRKRKERQRPMVVVVENDLESAKRQIAARFAHLCEDSAGGGGNSAEISGTGSQPASG